MNNKSTRRNFLRNLGLVAIGSALGISGCEHEKEEYSNVKEETATVQDLIYCPSRHSSEINPTVSFDGDDISIGMDIDEVDFPEKWGVVFECEHHGNFVVVGENERHKKLWERMKKNKTYKITYRDVFTSRYDGDKLLGRKPKDYWFLDARPIESSTSQPVVRATSQPSGLELEAETGN